MTKCEESIELFDYYLQEVRSSWNELRATFSDINSYQETRVAEISGLLQAMEAKLETRRTELHGR